MQPRRVAATTIAARVAEEMGVKLGVEASSLCFFLRQALLVDVLVDKPQFQCRCTFVLLQPSL